MFKNKAKIKALESELARTKRQLHKVNSELKREKEFSSYCWNNYAQNLMEHAELEKEINTLKTENKKLDLIIKAFKAVEQAHNNYTKEA